MAPGNTLGSTRRFKGKCRWLRPWLSGSGHFAELRAEVRTMSEAEIAKFWWSRAFVRYKSRARAKGKGQESHDLDYSSDSEDEKPQRRHMLIADGGTGEREARDAEWEAESRARAKGKGKDSSGIDLSGGLGAVDARNDP
jgi:hypothetical protein|tara:strand:+ start:1046 stop:1465 length:420 start_codon:yes stop_codon:yes gene_type:complete